MTDLLNGFIDKKKAESNFLSLEDGESVRELNLTEMKMMTKAGFGGEEKEVIRFKCLVQTSEGAKIKDFDNGTQRFAQEMQAKGVTIGSSFVITRVGTSTKTRYNVSEVTNPQPTASNVGQIGAMPTAAPAPVAEVAPVASAPTTTAPTAP